KSSSLVSDHVTISHTRSAPTVLDNRGLHRRTSIASTQQSILITICVASCTFHSNYYIEK
ncbi:hypothetical protein X975_11743, partial [Stegodyphus mimosarum]